MSAKSQDVSARETLDAVRLAVAGAADDRVALTIIRTLLADGPPVDPKSTASVRRFLRAVKRQRGWRFSVNGTLEP